MKLFGLTGGLGMGKSACADLLGKRGLPVVDTDNLAHELTRPGSPALDEIVSAFGASMLDERGGLRRAAMADIVFDSAEARVRLEAILHPKIMDAWKSQAARWRAKGETLGVVVIPLLFETNAQSCFDETVCVACSPATQHARLSARGWSDSEIERRNQAQLPVEEKMVRSRLVLWTEGSLEALDEQLSRVFFSDAKAPASNVLPPSK